jgi:hypothetical protein
VGLPAATPGIKIATEPFAAVVPELFPLFEQETRLTRRVAAQARIRIRFFILPPYCVIPEEAFVYGLRGWEKKHGTAKRNSPSSPIQTFTVGNGIPPSPPLRGCGL